MQLQLLEYSSLEMAVVMHILRLDTPIVPSGIVLEIISLSLWDSFTSLLFLLSVVLYSLLSYKLILVHVDFSGSGAAMDVVVSSIRAYLSALNKMSSFIGALNASSEAPESISVQTSE